MKLSRHARNNIKLYEIAEDDIRKTIEFPDIIEKESLKTIAIKKFSGKYSGFPLKVVFSCISSISVIPAGIKRESSIFFGFSGFLLSQE